MQVMRKNKNTCRSYRCQMVKLLLDTALAIFKTPTATICLGIVQTYINGTTRITKGCTIYLCARVYLITVSARHSYKWFRNGSWNRNYFQCHKKSAAFERKLMQMQNNALQNYAWASIIGRFDILNLTTLVLLCYQSINC